MMETQSFETLSAFKTRMIGLEIVSYAKDCFHDLSCLIFDFYWICSIIAIDLIILLRSIFSISYLYTGAYNTQTITLSDRIMLTQ